MIIHIYKDSLYWATATVPCIPREGEYIKTNSVEVLVEQVVYDLQGEEPEVIIFVTIVRNEDEIQNTQEQNESAKQNQENRQAHSQTGQESGGQESYYQNDEKSQKTKYSKNQLIAAKIIVFALWLSFLIFIVYMIKPRPVELCPTQEILPGTGSGAPIAPDLEEPEYVPPQPHKGIFL